MTSVAKRSHDIIISVYAISIWGSDILLGKVEESLSTADATGEGMCAFLTTVPRDKLTMRISGRHEQKRVLDAGRGALHDKFSL